MSERTCGFQRLSRIISPQEAIRELPSTMSRLVFLAGLRDPNTDVYSHRSETAEADRTTVDGILRGIHEETFAAWLSFGLQEQQADLDLFFSGLGCSRCGIRPG